MKEQQDLPEVSFETSDLLESARRETGLADFGAEEFREGLEVLTRSIEEEADLSAAGRLAQHGRILGSLCTRLVAQDHFNRHPEILAEKIESPLFVVGLARTGTTRLHRLLACDSDAYSVLWWEARFPSPFAENGDWRTRDQRIAAAHAEIDMILETQPVLASIHPWDAEGPDEEIMLCEHDFKSWVPESFMNVPSYIAWMADQDLRPTYAYLANMLRFLQWQKKESGREATRWVLKAPFHLGFGEILFETFPEARIIQTHRDPCETLPSIASMAYALWQLNRADVDPHLLGRQSFERWHGAIHDFMAVRDAMPPENFFDCDFRAVGRDPLAEIRRIYAWLDLPFESQSLGAMKNWLSANARDKRAAHEYSLETFGLPREDIESAFASYRQRFGLSDP
jgi:hypothetical protein